jgi:hypothetical protein
MLIIIGVLVTATATVTAALGFFRARAAAAEPPLGWVSEQWLAEHRATHPS